MKMANKLHKFKEKVKDLLSLVASNSRRCSEHRWKHCSETNGIYPGAPSGEYILQNASPEINYPGFTLPGHIFVAWRDKLTQRRNLDERIGTVKFTVYDFYGVGDLRMSAQISYHNDISHKSRYGPLACVDLQSWMIPEKHTPDKERWRGYAGALSLLLKEREKIFTIPGIPEYGKRAVEHMFEQAGLSLNSGNLQKSDIERIARKHMELEDGVVSAEAIRTSPEYRVIHKFHDSSPEEIESIASDLVRRSNPDIAYKFRISLLHGGGSPGNIEWQADIARAIAIKHGLSLQPLEDVLPTAFRQCYNSTIDEIGMEQFPSGIAYRERNARMLARRYNYDSTTLEAALLSCRRNVEGEK